jgi:hypothetical protein
MRLLKPSPKKFLASLVIYVFLICLTTSVSVAFLPNPDNVLGAMVTPDFRGDQLAASSGVMATIQNPNLISWLLLAATPYNTHGFPDIVNYIRYTMLVALYAISFVSACMLASIWNKPFHTGPTPAQRRHLERKRRK